MRVMLVKPIIVKHYLVVNQPHPEVGDRDEAVATWSDGVDTFYQLEKYPPDHGFNVKCFAILPEPSDEVAIEAEQEALIYQR